MAKDEWFRRRSWTAEDQAAFFSRLSRSRSAHTRDQYLRIQALELEMTGELALVQAALTLLDMLVERYPESTQLAQVRAQQATCRVKLGDMRGAVAAYRLALQAEAERRGVRTNSAIELPWLIATEKLADEYAAALSLLASCKEEPLFPVLRFRLHGAWALILAAEGRSGPAAVHARRAVAAASATHSGFRYHRDLGLVSPDERQVDRIRQIVAAAEQGDEADKA